MNRFFSSWLDNCRALPRNLLQGLRPGSGNEGEGMARRLRRNFLYHLHPLKITERALHPLVTLGLGVMTLVLFLLLTGTGILLMIYYVPTTSEAFASIQDIQYMVTFGAFVRALHRWAAHGMVITIFLHLVRVAAMGAFRRRELNWLFGLSLLLLTLGLSFTGYLLPWDQRSFWAVNVASSMLDNLPGIGTGIKELLLGGDQVGQATLTRFYMLHVALLPIGAMVLIALHLWRIRKDGGLAVSADDPRLKLRDAWPGLFTREVILTMGVVAVFFLVATFIQAPLGGPPDFHRPSNPEKAPWYFLWVQEMVSYSAPAGGFWFPGLFLSGLLLWPFLDRDDRGVGYWFGQGAVQKSVLAALVMALVAFCLFELFYLRAQTSVGAPGSNQLMQDILNPASGMLLLALLASVLSGWFTGSTRAAFLSGMMVLLVAVVGCTLIGLCRGPGWVFYWPWEEWPLVI